MSAEMRGERMHVIATAGHVDHGKSTLVRALTGMEPDRWAEERRRGMTIDLGFAWTELPGGQTVAFVDVPGHERFVGAMLAGVGPVPAVMFVVAADEGWMPQSAEHLDALAALGTRHGLLVITRSDLMEPELALEEARRHLGASPLGELPAVSVSGATGAGMDELRGALAELVAGLPAADPNADVRLWVDRAFTIRGAGTVLTGTLPGGRIAVDDELLLEPGGRRVSVRGLQALGRPVDEVTGVARVAVNLRGLPRESVGRGDVLVTPGRWLTTSVLDVRLHPTPPGAEARPDAELPQQLHLHIGAAAVPVRVRPLGSDPAGGATARLTLSSPLPLRIGDRGLLRDPGRQRVAAGLTVLDVRPPALTRRGSAARRAGELASMTAAGDPAAEVTRRGLVRRDELAAMGVDLGRLSDRGALSAGEWLLDRERATELSARLVAAVAEHDAADPLDPGLPVGAARRALELPDAKLVDALLRHPPSAGQLVAREGRVRQAGPGDALPTEVRRAMAALRVELTASPFAAPEAGRLAELGLGPRELAGLVRAGELVKVADGVYLLPGADEAAVEVLATLDQPKFTLSTARQALGTSRRVAVPLLERLARLGLTRRTEDGCHRLARD
jgi:selenocysteine-specific elongation factor